MEKQNKMVYAYKGDSIVNIEDVERGKECGCTCPACEKPLVAKKGPKKMHHFAHLKKVKTANTVSNLLCIWLQKKSSQKPNIWLSLLYTLSFLTQARMMN